MEINQLYKDFIDTNIIRNIDDLIEILKNFPFYYKIEKYDNIDVIKIRKTSRTDLYSSVDLENKEYKKMLSNMIINKYNYMDYYYFGKEKNEITTDNLFSLLNRDIKLKDFSFYKYNDNIEYHLCYVNSKWCITSKNKFDIFSIQNKNKFEKYTLYELLLKAFNWHKINLNTISKKYNYVFTLNTLESNLTVSEHIHLKLQILTIIDKKTNKEIDLNEQNIIKLRKPLNIIFDDIFHLKRDINISNNQKLIIKNNKTNKKYIYNYPKFNIKYIYLNNFNNNPIQNILDLIGENNIDTLIDLFPIYKNFIQNFVYMFEKKKDYLLQKYINIYIKKNINNEYQPYDKELLAKIHLVYRSTRNKIKREHIHYILLSLSIDKINKIFKINYQLEEI